MKLTILAAVLAVAALTIPARAQAIASKFDPQIVDMLLEVKQPHNWLLSDRMASVGFPDELLQAAAAGQVEIRTRIEFSRWNRVLRFFLLVLPPNTPSPLPQSPDPNDQTVAVAFDVRIEHLTWDDTAGPQSLAPAFIGKVLGRLSPRFVNPPDDEHLILTFRFDKADTNNVQMVSFTIPGVLTGAGPVAKGHLVLDRPPL